MTNHEVCVLMEHAKSLRDAALACTHKTKDPDWHNAKETALHTRVLDEMGRRYSIILTADWMDEWGKNGKSVGRNCWYWHFSISGKDVDQSDIASFVGAYFMGKKPAVYIGEDKRTLNGLRIFHGYVKIGKDLPPRRTEIMAN